MFGDLLGGVLTGTLSMFGTWWVFEAAVRWTRRAAGSGVEVDPE